MTPILSFDLHTHWHISIPLTHTKMKEEEEGEEGEKRRRRKEHLGGGMWRKQSTKTNSRGVHLRQTKADSAS